MLKEIVNLGLLYQKHGLAIVFNIEASSCALKDNIQVGSKVGLSSLVQKRFDIVFEEIARKVSESLFLKRLLYFFLILSTKWKSLLPLPHGHNPQQ